MRPKKNKYFHLSISPVQSFINQGRRTRDFWAGSFLISFLCATAQKSVMIRCAQEQAENQNKKKKNQKQEPSQLGPILPEENEQLSKALQSGEAGPQYACLPNRFSAIVPEKFNAEQAKEIIKDVQECWNLMWQAVFDRDLGTLFGSNHQAKDRCYAVWERQLNNYWEIHWAITPDLKTGFQAMKNRKLRREHLPSEAAEPGVKCNYFAGLQEISGITQPDKNKSLQQTVIDDFWTPLRTHRLTQSGEPIRLEHDIDDQEMLCAVAYFKRRFAFYFPQFIYQDETSVLHPLLSRIRAFVTKDSLPNTKPFTLSGWTLDGRVPSVTFIAAANWLRQIAQHIVTQQDDRLLALFQQFVAEGSDNDSVKSRYLLGFSDDITQTLAAFKDGQEIHLGCLEGNSCYDFLLQGENDLTKRRLRQLEQQQKNSPDEHTITQQIALFDKQSKKTQKRLIQLQQLKEQLPDNLKEPERYYAVIALDGDHLGQFISKISNQGNNTGKIGKALSEYTQKAQETVKNHHGFLIYAGGEDLVALLPGADALNCAHQLQIDFTHAVNSHFKRNAHTNLPTISAAVQFNHVNVPLMRVLRDVQQLLSGVAKQQYGRDAIAIRIVNQSGIQQQWGAKWRKFIEFGPVTNESATDRKTPRIRLYDIIDGLRDCDEVTSNNFLYHLRHIAQQLGMLNPERHTADYQSRQNQHHGTKQHQPDMLKSLVTAQYLRTQNRNLKKSEQVDLQWMNELFTLCDEITTKQNHQTSTHFFNPDIAFIAKFLCSKVRCNTTPEPTQNRQEAQV